MQEQNDIEIVVEYGEENLKEIFSAYLKQKFLEMLNKNQEIS